VYATAFLPGSAHLLVAGDSGGNIRCACFGWTPPAPDDLPSESSPPRDQNPLPIDPPPLDTPNDDDAKRQNRVFDWREASQQWLGSRRPTRPAAQWQAHPGGVYALAVVGAASPSPVLLSCGDDGQLKGWSVRAIEAAAAAAAAQQQQPSEPTPAYPASAGRIDLKPLFSAAVPRAEPPFPITVSAAPAAQTIAVDEASGRVYVGASDGGAHALDLQLLGAGGGGGGRVGALGGHAAAVLGMDFCGATGQLATASEVSFG